MINKWRATPRASNVLVDKSHNMFVAVCLFNMLFLVCFLHREYLVSLIMLLLLFITLILWYIRVHAWYVIVQPKTDDEIIELKEEFDKAHAEEAPELREEKWNHKETILFRGQRPFKSHHPQHTPSCQRAPNGKDAHNQLFREQSKNIL